MALLTSLQGYWKMDEASGTRADATANANTLTDNNTVASATGKINNGADFDKSNSESLSRTNAAQTGLGITGALSINCWVTLESSTGSNNTIVAKVNSGGRGYHLTITTSNSIIFYVESVATGVSSAETNTNVIPDDSTFRMITATFTTSGSNRCKIYVNGVSQSISSSLDNASTIESTTAPFSIGCQTTEAPSTSLFYDGIIDEIGVWSKALTQSEIDQLYNSGSGLAYPFSNAYSITASAGSFELTGQSNVFNYGRTMVASVGSFILSGVDALFRASGWPRESKNSSAWSDSSLASSSFSNESKSSQSWSNQDIS